MSGRNEVVTCIFGNGGREKEGNFEFLVICGKGDIIFFRGEQTHHLRTATAGRCIGGDGGAFGVLGRGG